MALVWHFVTLPRAFAWKWQFLGLPLAFWVGVALSGAAASRV
jgi:hypothetical protein